MESNLYINHCLGLEFKLCKPIVLCLRLWSKVGNKWKHYSYFTWVRVDINKKYIRFHLGPLSFLFFFFLIVFVCLMFFFSCVTTCGSWHWCFLWCFWWCFSWFYSWKCLFVAQGVICALQWLWCYLGVPHKVFLVLLQHYLGVFVDVRILHNIIWCNLCLFICCSWLLGSFL